MNLFILIFVICVLIWCVNVIYKFEKIKYSRKRYYLERPVAASERFSNNIANSCDIKRRNTWHYTDSQLRSPNDKFGLDRNIETYQRKIENIDSNRSFEFGCNNDKAVSIVSSITHRIKPSEIVCNNLENSSRFKKRRNLSRRRMSNLVHRRENHFKPESKRFSIGGSFISQIHYNFDQSSLSSQGAKNIDNILSSFK